MNKLVKWGRGLLTALALIAGLALWAIAQLLWALL